MWRSPQPTGGGAVELAAELLPLGRGEDADRLLDDLPRGGLVGRSPLVGDLQQRVFLLERDADRVVRRVGQRRHEHYRGRAAEGEFLQGRQLLRGQRVSTCWPKAALATFSCVSSGPFALEFFGRQLLPLVAVLVHLHLALRRILAQPGLLRRVEARTGGERPPGPIRRTSATPSRSARPTGTTARVVRRGIQRRVRENGIVVVENPDPSAGIGSIIAEVPRSQVACTECLSSATSAQLDLLLGGQQRQEAIGGVLQPPIGLPPQFHVESSKLLLLRRREREGLDGAGTVQHV